MTRNEFENKVCEDLGMIKADLKTLKENYVPCEKDSIKKSIKTNRAMIFSLYGFIGTLFLAITSTFFKGGKL